MVRHQVSSRVARFAATGAILGATTILSGCLPQQCEEGNNGRFACDPSASLTAPALEEASLRPAIDTQS